MRPVHLSLAVTLVTAVVLGTAAPASAARPQQPAPAAGPPVSYTDQAEDAYRVVVGDTSTRPGTPNPLLNVPELDLLAAGFEPVSSGRKGAGGGYRTWLRVAATPTPDGYYVSQGDFVSAAGEQCQLYHFLHPGTRAFANAFCGLGETRRNVGQVFGGPVDQSGTTLSAVFDNRSVPPLLQEVDRTLSPLRAYTCLHVTDPRGCDDKHLYDTAVAPTSSYRI